MSIIRAINEWVSAAEASRVIGCAEWHVAKLAEQGRLSVKRLPGVGRPRYRRSECERLARRIVKQATVVDDQETPPWHDPMSGRCHSVDAE